MICSACVPSPCKRTKQSNRWLRAGGADLSENNALKRRLANQARGLQSVRWNIGAPPPRHDIQTLEKLTLREDVITKEIENKNPKFLLTTERTRRYLHLGDLLIIHQGWQNT